MQNEKYSEKFGVSYYFDVSEMNDQVVGRDEAW